MISEQQIDNITIVKILDQRLDARAAPDFKAHLQGVIEKGNHIIVLDLSQVNFIDSSGLGAIISSLKTLKGRGELVISGTNNMVRSLFKLTRMDKVFQMFDNTNQAVSELTVEV